MKFSVFTGPGLARLGLSAAIILIFGVSCKTPKRGIPVEVPQQFSVSGEAQAPDKWWEAFEDPNLNHLVEQALRGNIDVMTAWDRLEQATAVAKMAGAGLWPEVTAALGVSHNEYMGSDSGSLTNPEGTFYSLSIAASYEVDLWGRVRSSRRAARRDLRATREDLQTVAMTISGEVARTWYELVEQRLQLEILSQQSEVNEDYLELLELRFSQGMSPAAEVLQQQRQVATTSGEIPLVEMRIALLEHALAVLLGEHPKTKFDLEAEDLPDLPPLPATGLPADLLLRRPDVKAAQLRLEAADYRAREAIAKRFPTLSISVSASDRDEEFRSLFDNWVLNLAANLVAPIFDAGRRKQEVRRTRAVASERLHDFAKTVLKALKEVEDALAQEARQAEFLESLEVQVDLSRQALEFSRQRYMKGATDYLPVLINLQTLQSLERKQMEAKNALISYRIALYRALGGGWELESPSSEENETPADNGDSQ